MMNDWDNGCSRPSRREFLTAAAVVSAGSLVAPIRSAQADETDVAPAPTPRIDCHLHCFAGENDPRFPYHANAPYRPAAAATPERLLECMDGAGVASAIVVHPEPYQDDHRYLQHCLEVGGGRLKGTALVFADTLGAPDRLRELAEQLPLIAVRVLAALWLPRTGAIVADG
jgi:hypothetical protein